MAEIILDKINYTYSDGTAYEIQALRMSICRFIRANLSELSVIRDRENRL